MNTKKKVFSEYESVFSTKLGEELGIFCLIIQRSNLDERTPKSRWGTLNLDEGTLTLDGGTTVYAYTSVSLL